MNNSFNRRGQCGSNCPRSRESSCACQGQAWSPRFGCSCQKQAWTTRAGSCGCGDARNIESRAGSCGCGDARNIEPRTDSCGCGAKAFERRSFGCGCASQANEIRSSDCGFGAQTIENRSTDCRKCDHGADDTGILNGKSLAMVYSPYQNYEELYDPREGLCNGTIFCKLNKPFYGDRRI